MEANKEEALKAKQIAEAKMEKLDYAGAKRFAIKARDMYPRLDGLQQLLTTLDVYTSAEKGVHGEVNWHRVLGVSCFADQDTIQKKFRKLALLLHPDKNKSVGAEGAFKLLHEAREKVIFQKKDGVPDANSGMPTSTSNSTSTSTSTQTNTSTSTTAFHDFFRRDDRWSTPSNMHFGSPAEPYAKPADSFVTPTIPHASATGFKPRDWSATHSMPSGGPSEPWVKPTETYATSTVPRATDFKPRYWSATPCMPSATPAKPFVTPTVPTMPNATGNKPPPSSTKPSASGTKPSSSGTKPRAKSTKTKPCEAPTSPPFTVSVSKERPTFWTICNYCMMYFEYDRKYQNHKLQCHNCQKYFLAHAVSQPKNASKSTPFDPLQQKLSQPSMPTKPSGSGSSHGAATEMGSKGSSSPLFSSAGVQREQASTPNSSQAGGSSHPSGVKRSRKRYQPQEMPTNVGMGNGGVATHNDGLGSSESNSDRERPDVRFGRPKELPLLQKILMDKALNGLFKNLDLSSNPSVPKTADADVKDKGPKEAVAPETQVDMIGNNASLDAENMTSEKPAPAASDADLQDGDTGSMIVPDPDFHDFDNDRTEKAFASNQVWAAYDDDGGLPRYYAMIHSIISLKPFKMSISWLNSKKNDELAPIDWIACGFTKTSGEFRIGKYEDYTSLHAFSHKVNWTKGRRGAVCIYPGEGEVWALFRNWSPDWDEHTPDEVIHEYQMVQVVDGYDEERGLSFIPLVKFAGFKTVFRQHADKSFIRTIPREELFRFSHQVPSFLLSGNEGENAPKGCLELDPASTPMDLLQVKTEAELEMEETSRKHNQEGNAKVATETSVLENAEEKESADLMKNDPQATKWQVYARKRPNEGEAVEDAKRSRLGCT